MTAPKTDLETEWLRRGGLKPTRQRLAIATSLIGDGRNRHVTAESLHEAVQAKGDSVSLATVYNTLNAFRDAGLMQEVAVDGSKSIFCTKTNDHPHFFWEDEGRLTDAPAEQLDFAALPKPPEGMEIAKIDVIIRLRKKPAISAEYTHGAKQTDVN